MEHHAGLVPGPVVPKLEIRKPCPHNRKQGDQRHGPGRFLSRLRDGYDDRGRVPIMRGKSALDLRTTLLLMLLAAGCAGTSHNVFRDPNMDFGSLQAVAVLPFTNLTREQMAADRVRDVFMTMLQATGGVY